MEDAKQQSFKIDTIPPVVNASTDKLEYTRFESVTVHFSANDAPPGSGLASLSADVNGDSVTDGQKLDLSWKPAGTYTLTVNAADNAGLTTTRVTRFELVATLDSLQKDIVWLRNQEKIDSEVIARSMLAKRLRV